jgi:hypothetical protein
MAAAGGEFAVKDRPRALTVLIAVFFLGCLAGFAGSYFWLKKSPDLLVSRRSPDFRNGAMKNDHLPRPEPPNFRGMLQLTPEQYAQFQKIIGESRSKMTEFRKQTDDFHFEQDAKIKAVLSEMNHKLSLILNEEQKKKFAAWQKEFENTRRRPPRGRDVPPPSPR